MAKKELKSELQDLSRVLQEVTVSKEGCFYKYRDKKEIGQKIYNALMKKYKDDGGVFQFSDELPKSGILSQLQGFASVVSLFEGFDVSAKGKEAKAFIDSMIDYMIDEIYANGDIKIDATPYDLKAVFSEYDYIDSVTWIISAILGVMRLYIKGEYNIDFESGKGAKIIELYNYCLKYLLDSYIDDSTSKRKFNCGWNFTKDCEEPSLYFTFAVSELLIDILSTFEDVIRVADIGLIRRLIIETHDKKGFLKTERYLINQDKVKAALEEAEQDESVEGYGETLDRFYEFTDEEKELIKTVHSKIGFVEQEYAENKERIDRNREETQRQKALFALINDNEEVYSEGSPYKKFEEYCKKSANQVWELTSEGLASEFYSSNLESRITEETIASSVSSDAVFNVIFAINILINAGIDEDYEDNINYFTANDSDEYKKAIQDYDNMRDTIRLAYDNCYQYLMKLKKENKEYKIVEYNLNFDESFSKQAKNIKDIRKEHIRVFSLMPLMIRTKTTIGEFLIRYPQYDMMIYLEHILKYRCFVKEDKSYLWIWENDGYSTSSNYYFISAFAAFYDYYDKYEYVFHSNIYKNAKAKKEVEEAYLKSLQEAGKAVDKTEDDFKALETELEKKSEEIAILSGELQRLEDDPLRKALNGFIEEALQKTIISVLTTKLSEEASRIVSDAGERVKKNAEEKGGDSVDIDRWSNKSPEGESFEKSMRRIVLASLAAEQLGETIYSTKLTKEERYEALDELDRYVGKLDRDTKQAVRYHVQGIADDKSSAYVANKGESTLPISKHVKLMDILDKKTDKGEED